MTEVLSRRRLNRALLARQALLGREAADVVAMTERLAGLQAQVAAPPFLGLWTRIEGFHRDDLVAAIVDGRIVRATAMRGTIHLMSAGDYAAHRMALQPVLRTALKMPGVREVAGAVDVDALLGLAHHLLDEEPRTIAALRGPLEHAFPDHGADHLALIARMLLPLAQVPDPEHPDGFPGNARFAPAARVLAPGTPPLSPEAPAVGLVRRYLAAFGPATAADVTRWSGLTGVRELLADLPELAEFRDERGRTLHDLPDAPRPPEDVPAPVRFLPRFDNVVLAHADPARVVDPAHRPRIMTVNGLVHGTVLHDGFVVGTWFTAGPGDRPGLRVVPFVRVAQRTAASIRAEGRRVLRFLHPDGPAGDVVVEAPSG